MENSEVIGAFPRPCYNFLCVDWCIWRNRKKPKQLCSCRIMAAAWYIWLEHNSENFEDRDLEKLDVRCKI